MDKDKSSQLQQRTGKTIARLQTQFLAGSSDAKSTLALLRQSYSQPFGVECGLWDLEDGCLPDSVRNSKWFAETLAVDACERAAHTALCTYAFHQQGNNMPMHMRHDGMRHTFGNAVRQAAYKQRNDSKMPEAFRMMIEAQDFEELSGHLRRLIHFLSSHGVPYDYGAFATDLFFWQMPKSQDGVIRRWGHQWSSLRRNSMDSNDGQQEID